MPTSKTPSPIELRRRTIATTLSRATFLAQTEVELQDAVEQLLQRRDISYEREPLLSPECRPDFFSDGIVIKVKMRTGGGRRAVASQLRRYAELDSVHSLILLTTRNVHRDAFPLVLRLKPLTVVVARQGF